MNPLTKGCYSYCGATKGMNLRADGGGEINYSQNAWVTGVPAFLYCILFCYAPCVYYRH